MAEAPALSIVVPVYNGAATVGELVQALRGLAIEGGLEIVLVVDYSPDNSLDVCKTLAVRSLERRRVSGPKDKAVVLLDRCIGLSLTQADICRIHRQDIMQLKGCMTPP
jgi:glycosyltransferase involved in cell wall biosynthesis